MGFGFDFIDMKFKDRKAAIAAKEGRDPNEKPDSKLPGFSMGLPPSKEKQSVAPVEQVVLPKIDENTTEIDNIVFARDPTILDTEKKTVELLEAFQHHNYLDVKNLVRKRELLADEDQSPRAKAHMRLQRKMPLIFDKHVYKLQGAEDKTLLFESRFESGNLYLAQKVSDEEYNLLMQNDINTQGHTQWFYFRTVNTRAG